MRRRTALAYGAAALGAMGLTLEHPLHRWTYRARLLRTSLGGAAANQALAAARRWGVPKVPPQEISVTSAARTR